MSEREPQDGGGEAASSKVSEPAPTTKSRSHRRRRARRVLRPGTFGQVVSTDGPFLLVILGSILPLGAIHVPVFLVVSVVAILTGSRELLRSRGWIVGVPGMVFVLGALALYTALQAIPIPLGLLARLSPAAADTWRHALDPLGSAAPRLASLSLDPGASWVEALKWWTYAAVFVSGAAFGARHGDKWGAAVILGVASIVAASTIGHGLLNASRVFGVYAPSMGGRGWRIGPIVNANVLAGYLNLGLLAGIGLVASKAPPMPRWAIAIAVAMVFGVSANTGSRGGLAALVVGLVAMLPLVQRARRAEGALSDRDRTYVMAAVVLALGAGAIFATLAATGTTVHLLKDPSVSKLKMMLWAPAMIRDYPWFGVGRGAFEGAFPAYKMGDNNSVYTHPENFLVQWATEWGLPVACILVVAFGWLLRPNAWGANRSAAGSGLFAGFLCLAVQNIVDLGLEIPGVAIAACAAAGLAWGATCTPPGDTSREPRSLHLPLLAVTMIVVGVAFLVPAALIGTHTVRNDKEMVSQAFPEDPEEESDWDAFKALVGEAMKRHPGEPYFPRTGALFAMLRHSENPVPWIQRALDRARTSGRTHYLVAVLLARHRILGQSLLELRYAVREDPDLSGRAARIALRLTKQHDELMRVVPDGVAGAGMLSMLANAVRRSDEDLALRFFGEALERDPDAVGAHLAVSQILLNALAQQHLGSRCGEARRVMCQKAVLEHARALARIEPTNDDPLNLVGKLLLVSGRPAQATKLIAALCPTIKSRMKCRNIWIEAAAQSGDTDAFTTAIRFAERDGCTSPRACGEMYTFIGNTLSRVNGPHAALPYYKRAAAEDPSKANWMRIAAVAAFIGDHGEAEVALNRAAAFGVTPELKEGLELEHTRAMREALKLH